MFGCLRPIWRLSRAILRPILRLLWWSFLLTLPFHLLPYLAGLIEGVFMANITSETYFNALENFKQNVESAEWMDWYSVPGAPGIHDLPTGQYNLVHIRHPVGWHEKLGLKRFDVDTTNEVAMSVLPINEHANLDVLYRRRRSYEQKPWHHWVYLTAQSFHFDDLWFDQFDEAFDQLLRYHYANPSIGDFHYITCPGQFLCDVWQTRGPALLHLTTETPDLFVDKEFQEQRQYIPGYLPVTARIIEFPLEQPEELPLMPGVFPSPFEQMRSVTGSPHAWQIYNPYSALQQVLLRLGDRCLERERTHPQTYGRLRKMEKYVAWKIGQEDGFWPDLARMPTLLLSAWVKQGIDIVWQLALDKVHLFLGNSDEDQARVARAEEEELDLPPREDNFMGQMLRDFLDSMNDTVEGGLENMMKSSPEGREALDNMWDVVKRKPKQDDDEDEDEQGDVKGATH